MDSRVALRAFLRARSGIEMQSRNRHVGTDLLLEFCVGRVTLARPRRAKLVLINL
jgi:hypothetical protein